MTKRDTEKRLLDLSIKAIEAAAGNAGKAKLSLSKTMREQHDVELIRTLYAAYHNAAIDAAISNGYKDLRARGQYPIVKGTKAQPNANGGYGAAHTTNGYESTFPLAAASDADDADDADEHPPCGDAMMRARAHLGIELGLQTVEVGPEKPWRPHLDLRSLRDEKKAILSCALDIFLVNGKAARVCTGRELREFADHSNNKARFAAMLANGLSDEQVAGDHWTDEEANGFYEDAGFALPRK